jgi:hypothetical protein
VARPVARKKVPMVIDFMFEEKWRTGSYGDDLENVADSDDWRGVYIRMVDTK